MASSGSFSTSGYDGRYLVFSWSISSQSIANNTTTIQWSLKGAGTANASWYMAGPFTVVIAGSTVYSSSTRIQLYNGTTVASGTKTISHNSAGAASFSASVSAAIYTFAVNCSGSGSWSLTSIPRQATITSAPNFNDEANPSITYSNPAGSAVTTLQACISLTGSTDDIAYRNITKTGTSYTFNLTESERNVLRNATTTSNTRDVYFYIRTVIGGTTFSSYLKRTLTIINNTPVFSSSNLSYEDTNASIVSITGDSSMIVQNKSNLKVMYTAATAQKGATISSYIFKLGSRTETSTSNGGTIDFGKINSTSNLTLTVQALDSRGNYSSEAELTIKCYAYSTPTISNFKAYRINSASDDTANVNGTYIQCTYTPKYSSVNSTNSIIATPYLNGAEVDSSKIVYNQDNIIRIDVGDNTSTYKVYIKITDKYNGVDATFTETVFGSSRIFNVTKDGTGFAIGKMAEENNLFECRWPSKFDDTITVKAIDGTYKTLLNLFYPIGSIYQSTESTNPANLFGGTWEPIEDTFLLAAGSTYSAGDTGGESSHTLTISEMPSHEGHLYSNAGSTRGGNINAFLNRDTLGIYGNSGRGWVVHDGNEVHPVGFSRGESQAHNNMPPYYTVYMWRRIA